MFKNWFHEKAYPEFWEHYLRGMQRPLPGSTPLRDIPFAVFDTETTGLNPAKDKILSIGGVKVQHNRIEAESALELYLEQSVAPRQEDIAVHGIIPSAHARQHSMEESVRRFVEWCGNAVLAGHHVAFDIAVVNRALQRCGYTKLRNRSVDTLQLAVRVAGQSGYATPGTWSLDALAHRYHIPVHDRHTAAGDAFITGILLLKLLHRLENRGVENLGQLLQYRGGGL